MRKAMILIRYIARMPEEDIPSVPPMGSPDIEVANLIKRCQSTTGNWSIDRIKIHKIKFLNVRSVKGYIIGIKKIGINLV